MRITRIVTWTVTAGLVGLTPIAIAAPSQAADNWTTTTTAAPDKTRIVYGDACEPQGGCGVKSHAYSS